MRRLLLLALVLTLAAPAASAKAPTVKANLSEGFLYYRLFILSPTTYGFDHVAIYDSDPGTVVRLACVDGAPSCPFEPVERSTDAGRYVNLQSPSLRRHRFRRGDRIQITRTSPDGRGTLSRYELTARGFQRTERSCNLADGTPSPCVIDCPVGGPPSPTLPCSEVTGKLKLLPKSVRVGWSVGYAKNGDTRFKQLTLRGLPSGTSVFLLCIDKTLDTPCRKYVEFFPPSSPGPKIDLDLTALVAGRSLPPGTTVTLRLHKKGYRRQELRYTMRKNRPPSGQALCLDPGVDEAQRC